MGVCAEILGRRHRLRFAGAVIDDSGIKLGRDILFALVRIDRFDGGGVVVFPARQAAVLCVRKGLVGRVTREGVGRVFAGVAGPTITGRR